LPFPRLQLFIDLRDFKDFNTVNFVEIFDSPKIATRGLLGFSNDFSSASSSPINNSPHKLVGHILQHQP